MSDVIVGEDEFGPVSDQQNVAKNNAIVQLLLYMYINATPACAPCDVTRVSAVEHLPAGDGLQFRSGRHRRTRRQTVHTRYKHVTEHVTECVKIPSETPFRVIQTRALV